MSSFLRKIQARCESAISVRVAHVFKPVYLWEQVSSIPDVAMILLTAVIQKRGYVQIMDGRFSLLYFSDSRFLVSTVTAQSVLWLG
jgi:hypothetical protein